MPAVFVITRDGNGKFVFDIVNRNRTIATSAPYSTKALLQNQISGISPNAVIDDQSLIRRPAATAKAEPVTRRTPVKTAPAKTAPAKRAPAAATAPVAKKAAVAKKTLVRRARSTG